jgi:hypothetical protein
MVLVPVLIPDCAGYWAAAEAAVDAASVNPPFRTRYHTALRSSRPAAIIRPAPRLKFFGNVQSFAFNFIKFILHSLLGRLHTNGATWSETQLPFCTRTRLRRKLWTLPCAGAMRDAGRPTVLNCRRARRRSRHTPHECAIKSVRPIWVSRLAPTRPAWRSPLNVITGTPIHSASQVVVVPLKGKGSSGNVHPMVEC